jgi:hypothetical protein
VGEVRPKSFIVKHLQICQRLRLTTFVTPPSVQFLPGEFPLRCKSFKAIALRRNVSPDAFSGMPLAYRSRGQKRRSRGAISVRAGRQGDLRESFWKDSGKEKHHEPQAAV